MLPNHVTPMNQDQEVVGFESLDHEALALRINQGAMTWDAAMVTAICMNWVRYLYGPV